MKLNKEEEMKDQRVWREKTKWMIYWNGHWMRKNQELKVQLQESNQEETKMIIKGKSLRITEI